MQIRQTVFWIGYNVGLKGLKGFVGGKRELVNPRNRSPSPDLSSPHAAITLLDGFWAFLANQT